MTARNLARHFGAVDKLLDASQEEIQEVEGIGPDRAEAIAEWFSDEQNRTLVAELRELGLRFEVGEEEKPIEGPLTGTAYVITGTLESFSREEAEAALESLGAKVSDNVSKKTTGVVVGESPGSKAAKAAEGGRADPLGSRSQGARQGRADDVAAHDRGAAPPPVAGLEELASARYHATHGTWCARTGARNSLSQLRRGAVEYCVLALLRDGERYGFELVRKLSEVDGLVTSEGTIYPLLTRLRRDQLVTTFWRESETGPPRRYYQLTDEGREALAGFTEEWARFRDGVDGLLEQEGTR